MLLAIDNYVGVKWQSRCGLWAECSVGNGRPDSVPAGKSDDSPTPTLPTSPTPWPTRRGSALRHRRTIPRYSSYDTTIPAAIYPNCIIHYHCIVFIFFIVQFVPFGPRAALEYVQKSRKSGPRASWG